MRVLVVSQYFWPELFRINDLVLGLKDRGHEITVLTGIPNYPSGSFYSGYGCFSPAKEMFHEIPVYRAPVFPRGNGRALSMALNYLSFALSASFWAPFFCRKKFDLIFVFEPSPITVGLPALVFKKINKVPIFFWVQDLWPESLFATGVVQSDITKEKDNILIDKILNYIGKLVVFCIPDATGSWCSQKLLFRVL